MAATDTLDTIAQLRTRMERLHDGVPRLPLETHPALAGLVQLRAGGSYAVDSATLALALMAGPSRAGSWCAVVGVGDFGAEAASALGVDLDRTVLVPDPGDAVARGHRRAGRRRDRGGGPPARAGPRAGRREARRPAPQALGRAGRVG